MKKIIVMLFIVFQIVVLAKSEITTFTASPFMDENLKGQGMLIEMINEAYKSAGYNDYEIKFYPYKRAVLNFEKNQCVGYIGGFVDITEEQIKEKGIPFQMFNIRFTLTYYLPNKKNIEFETVADLKKYNIGLLMGHPLVEYLKNNGVTTDEARELKLSILKLEKGRIDAFLGVDLNAAEEIKINFSGNKDEFAQTKPLISAPAGIIFNKNDKNGEIMSKKLAEGFEKIKKNGKYLEIAERYYGKGKVPEGFLVK